MSETTDPNATKPADPGPDEAATPDSDESFLAPSDADAEQEDERAGDPERPVVPPPPD